MRRLAASPRPDWARTVERQGLVYHHWNDGGRLRQYWDESACYSLTPEEAATLRAATDELHELCLRAVQHVVDTGRYAEFGLRDEVAEHVAASWRSDPPSLYGRFDFVYDGTAPPKLLEYNADTPTCLLEAAAIQWRWAQEVGDEVAGPGSSQFNALHDTLIATWEYLRPRLPGRVLHVVHSSADVYGEDYFTTMYLADTAEQAGIRTRTLRIEDVGWDDRRGVFVDVDGEDMTAVFKLYPWEWLLSERYAPQLLASLDRTTWVEPIWKMLLSNKALLPLLWELNPGHPNLLPAYADSPRDLTAWVRKPLLGREGANITVVTGDPEQPGVATGGAYGDEGFVYQQYAPLPSFAPGTWTVVGSWVVGHTACGVGLRESATIVTDERQVFRPHLVTAAALLPT